jgi:hypothetical protein
MNSRNLIVILSGRRPLAASEESSLGVHDSTRRPRVPIFAHWNFVIGDFLGFGPPRRIGLWDFRHVPENISKIHTRSNLDSNLAHGFSRGAGKPIPGKVETV